MHVDLLVETQRLSVLHEAFEHGVVDSLGTHLGVWMTEMAQIRDPGFFEIRQVATVMDDAHGVGLGEANPDSVGEWVVGRVERRLG